jgi:NAD(P)-dependent dehydrogenase (short-subunit alcohol dehydrogenase family)
MTGLLKDRLAVITGAGSGIGSGIARSMAAAGARVVCVGSTPASVTAIAAELGGLAMGCNVADREACDRLAEEVRSTAGPAAILVNNAGLVKRRGITAPEARQDWDETMAVNLDGPFNMVTAFLDQLAETRGAIINIASVQSFVVRRNSAAYGASKGGVRLLTSHLAVELAPMGIRVNAIAPGVVATPMTRGLQENPALVAETLQRVPLGRLGEPGDIGDPCVFLASDMARFITGVTLPVDGGYLCY